MSMSRAITTAVISLALAIWTANATAAAILMATDGQSAHNIIKAGELGHTITTSSLMEIDAMMPEERSAFDVIFISPGLSMGGYDALRSHAADGGSLQLYVATGGTLVLNVAGNYDDQFDIAPDGVDFIRALHNTETFADPNHEYLTGDGYGGAALAESDFPNWMRTDHGYLTGLPADAAIVLSNTDGPSFVEYPHGDGRVILTTLTYGWADNGEARGNPQDNLINYAAVPEPASLAILAIGAVLVLRRRS